MRKTATTLTVSTVVLGVFGAFFRWLQNANAFEKDTGLPIRFHGTSVVFVIYLLLAAAAIAVLCIGWLRRYVSGSDVSALRSGTVLPRILGWVFGLGFALAACILMFRAGTARYPAFQRLLGALGIPAGLCFPFLFGKQDGGAHGLGRTAAGYLTLFCCFFLIFSYRLHADDPVIWGFAPEILAAAANAVAFYQLAAFHFGAGRSSRALPAVMLAVLLDLSGLFDDRSAAVTVLLVAQAAMLLTAEYLLIENLRDKGLD